MEKVFDTDINGEKAAIFDGCVFMTVRSSYTKGERSYGGIEFTRTRRPEGVSIGDLISEKEVDLSKSESCHFIFESVDSIDSMIASLQDLKNILGE